MQKFLLVIIKKIHCHKLCQLSNLKFGSPLGRHDGIRGNRCWSPHELGSGAVDIRDLTYTPCSEVLNTVRYDPQTKLWYSFGRELRSSDEKNVMHSSRSALSLRRGNNDCIFNETVIISLRVIFFRGVWLGVSANGVVGWGGGLRAFLGRGWF